MMPATRSSGVVRGGSTVPAIWIWLLHKQEVSGSWNWLLHKQESWKVDWLLYKQESWKVDWLLYKQEVSGVWISGAPTIAVYGRRRLTSLEVSSLDWRYSSGVLVPGSCSSSTVPATCLEVAVRY